jgi:hypothetical protein
MISYKLIYDLFKMGLKIDDDIHLEPVGDIHFGAIGFLLDLYRKAIERITNEPNRLTIFMGDQLDAITPYDKRFNPDTAYSHDIDEQRQEFQDETQPLIDEHKRLLHLYRKVLGFLHGNHEYNIRGITRPYIENQFCNNNALQFCGSRAVIGLDFRWKGKKISEDNQYKILAIHGVGGSKPEAMFEAMKTNNYMDIFLCGHSHQKRYQSEVVMDFDFKTGQAYEREIHLMNTGTFCKTLSEGHDGYMDRKNKVIPSSAGTGTLTISPYQEKITGHI